MLCTLTGSIRRGSLRIREEIGTRMICELDLFRDTPVKLGTPFTFSEVIGGSATLIFNGFVTSSKMVRLGGVKKMNHIVGSDVRLLLDKRILNAEYSSPTISCAGDIVNDIISRLDAEGISKAMLPGAVGDGADIESVEYNSVPMSRVLDELADMSDYVWWVDRDKLLWFRPPPASSETFIHETDFLYGTVEIEKDMLSYYNRVWIKNVPKLSEKVEDHNLQPPPDGETQVFTTRQPIAELISFYIGDEAQNVGIKNHDEDGDWFYIPNQPQLYQSETATPVASDTDMVAIYKYRYPVTVRADNTAAQAARAAIDSTSGIVEHVIYDSNAKNEDDALELALALVAIHSREPTILKYSTYKHLLNAGEDRQISAASFGLSGYYHVISVEITDPGRDDQILLKTYKMSNALFAGKIYRFYEEWLNKRRINHLIDSIYAEVIEG